LVISGAFLLLFVMGSSLASPPYCILSTLCLGSPGRLSARAICPTMSGFFFSVCLRASLSMCYDFCLDRPHGNSCLFEVVWCHYPYALFCAVVSPYPVRRLHEQCTPQHTLLTSRCWLTFPRGVYPYLSPSITVRPLCPPCSLVSR